MSSVISYITPLSAVSGTLIRAVGGTDYREAAERLLAESWTLEGLLRQAVQDVPRQEGASYFLDVSRLDPTLRQETFAQIRTLKEEIDSGYPLLSHAAGLVHYVAHTTMNLLPAISETPRLLAASSASGGVRYNGNSRTSLEWSIALYMGLSPVPIFGADVRYDEDLGRGLRPFGLGVFAYLYLAVCPEIVADGHLPPFFDYLDVRRPMAAASLGRMRDGSLVLLNLPPPSRHPEPEKLI